MCKEATWALIMRETGDAFFHRFPKHVREQYLLCVGSKAQLHFLNEEWKKFYPELSVTFTDLHKPEIFFGNHYDIVLISDFSRLSPFSQRFGRLVELMRTLKTVQQVFAIPSLEKDIYTFNKLRIELCS